MIEFEAVLVPPFFPTSHLIQKYNPLLNVEIPAETSVLKESAPNLWSSVYPFYGEVVAIGDTVGLSHPLVKSVDVKTSQCHGGHDLYSS